MVRVNGGPEDELLALDAGADDCIAGPFRFRKMVARLSAVLRPVRVRRAYKVPMLLAGQLEMDPERRLVRLRGEELSLSPQEFDLLLFFMKNREVAHSPQITQRNTGKRLWLQRRKPSSLHKSTALENRKRFGEPRICPYGAVGRVSLPQSGAANSQPRMLSIGPITISFSAFYAFFMRWR